MLNDNLPGSGTDRTPSIDLPLERTDFDADPDTEHVLDVLLAAVGLTGQVTRDLNVAMRGDVPNFLWDGLVVDDTATEPWAVPVPGRFFIPALFDSPKLPDALDKLAAQRRADGRPHDRQSCLRSMARWHSGLGDQQIGLLPWNYVEPDHLTVDEQLARYRHATEAVGIDWRMWVHTGGKSIHAYPATCEVAVVDDPRWLRIQRLLIACFEGDTAIQNRSRLMRLPGGTGRNRHHEVIHLSDCKGDTLDGLIAKLDRLAEILGVSDVDTAVDTLMLAHQLDNAAKKQIADAALEMREHATHLRATRGAPSSDDLDLADMMLGRFKESSGASSSSTKTGRSGSGLSTAARGSRTLRLDAASAYGGLTILEAAEQIGCGRDAHVKCPEHEGETLQSMVVHVTADGYVHAHCFSQCGHLKYGWLPLDDGDLDFVSATPSSEGNASTGTESVDGSASPPDSDGTKACVATSTTPASTSLSLYRNGRVDVGSRSRAEWLALGAIDRVLRPSDLVDGLLPFEDFAPDRDLALRGPTGIGKTRYLSRLTEQARSKGKRVVAVVPFRSLAGEVAGRLGIEDYRDHGGMLDGSVVVVINSLGRVSLYDFDDGEINDKPVDLLIIDEAMLISAALAPLRPGDGTMSGVECVEVWQTWQTMIRTAKRVVVSDAYLAGWLVDWLEELRGTRPFVVDVQIPSTRTARITHDLARWRDTLHKAAEAGEKLAVAEASSQGVRHTARVLRERSPGVPDKDDGTLVPAVSSAAPGHDPTEIRAKADTFRHLVYSPTLGAGVSIDVKGHYERILARARGGTVTAAGLLQLAGRVRHPCSAEVLYNVPRPVEDYRMPTPRHLLDAVLRRSETALKACREAGYIPQNLPTPYRHDGKRWLVRAELLTYLQWWSRCATWQYAVGAVDLGGALPLLLAEVGIPFEVDDAPPVAPIAAKRIHDPHRQAQRQTKEADKAAILAAEDLDDDEASQIASRGPQSVGEVAQLARHRVRKHYGDVSEEIVDFDGLGKGVAKTRVHAQVSLLAAGLGDVIIAGDAEAIVGSTPPTHLRGDYLKARALWTVIQMFQVAKGGPSGIAWSKASIDVSKVGRALELVQLPSKRLDHVPRVKQLKEVLETGGIKVTKKQAQEPIRLLSLVLRRIGVSLVSKRPVGEDGSPGPRVYNVNLERAAKVNEYAAPCRDRMLIRWEDRYGLRPRGVRELLAGLSEDDRRVEQVQEALHRADPRVAITALATVHPGMTWSALGRKPPGSQGSSCLGDLLPGGAPALSDQDVLAVLESTWG